MPIPTFNQENNTAANNTDETPNSRPTGSAGYASLGALSGMETNSSGRLVGTGSGGTVSAPGYTAGESTDVLQNAASDDRALSQEEANRLYEDRMEDEYAKREGGA